MNQTTDAALPETLGLILREYLKALPRRGRFDGEASTATQIPTAQGRCGLAPLPTVESSRFGRLSPPRL